jgi:hypothetical protein
MWCYTTVSLKALKHDSFYNYFNNAQLQQVGGNQINNIFATRLIF